MRLEEDLKLDFRDVLIKPKRSFLNSRSEVNLFRTFKFKNGVKWIGTPIISSNMSTVSTLSMHNALKKNNMLTCLHKHITMDDIRIIAEEDYEDSLILSCGSSKEEFKKVQQYMCVIPKLKFICVDVANGYMPQILEQVSWIKSAYPDRVLIAGNVVTPEGVEALIFAGADIVKIGIGSGSACTTRLKTAVGYPQLSAVIECADAAHGLGGYIISDGGCTIPGDVVKAFAGGADFVMLGGMLSGHHECEGNIVYKNSKKYMEFYGMSSEKANEEFAGGLKEYRASEGRELLVPYKGPVDNTIQDILGGLRSACTYTGSKKLKHLPKCTTFIRVNSQLNTSLSQYEM